MQLAAFVRSPAAIDARYRNVEVRASVEKAMAGQQAVICVLGSRTLLRRDLAIAVGVHNILTVMELSGIRD